MKQAWLGIHRIGENSVEISENHVVNVIAVGEQTDEIAGRHLRFHQEICTSGARNLRYLIDLNRAGKNSHGARKIWQEISESAGTDKVALFGRHPVARVMANFVIGAVSKDNMRFFSSKKEAEKWLGLTS